MRNIIADENLSRQAVLRSRMLSKDKNQREDFFFFFLPVAKEEEKVTCQKDSWNGISFQIIRLKSVCLKRVLL